MKLKLNVIHRVFKQKCKIFFKLKKLFKVFFLKRSPTTRLGLVNNLSGFDNINTTQYKWQRKWEAGLITRQTHDLRKDIRVWRSKAMANQDTYYTTLTLIEQEQLHAYYLYRFEKLPESWFYNAVINDSHYKFFNCGARENGQRQSIWEANVRKQNEIKSVRRIYYKSH